jgi:hypothetical protein
MGITDKLREVRRLYDIRDVLVIGANEYKIVCPLPTHVHASNTPSFVIFQHGDGTQRFRCHGNCGLEGDVIDLVGYLQIPDYDQHNREHVQRAISLLGTDFEISPVKWEPPKKGLAPSAWREHFPPGEEVIEYARWRGLHTNTLNRFKIGQYKHFMSMPAFEDGLLIAIKFRNIHQIDETKKDFDNLRFWSAKGSVKALFGYDNVAYTTAPIIVVKGEIPAMLLVQYGFLACAPTGGEGSYIEQWVPALSLSRRRVVVGDNDRDPEVRRKMQEKAKERADLLKADLRFPPEKYKDVDEFVLAEPHVALETIRQWLS